MARRRETGSPSCAAIPPGGSVSWAPAATTIAAPPSRQLPPMKPLDDPQHDREVGPRDSTLDTTRIDDVRIGAVRPLITPALLQERVPVQDETLAIVESSRAAIADVLHGRDDRLIVVVGPCSIHDHDQAIEYG